MQRALAVVISVGHMKEWRRSLVQLGRIGTVLYGDGISFFNLSKNVLSFETLTQKQVGKKKRFMTKTHLGNIVLFSCHLQARTKGKHSSCGMRGGWRILITEKTGNHGSEPFSSYISRNISSLTHIQVGRFLMVDPLLLKSQQIYYAASLLHSRVWTAGSPWVVFNCLLFSLAKKSCWCPIQLIL